MRAALKIVVDVLDYRLRHLEMANLAGAVSVMVALRLPAVDIVVRSVFALILNVLAYLINDVLDVEQDLLSGRAPEKTQFLANHRHAANGAQTALFVLLLMMALAYKPWLLVPAILGSGICWLYTAYFKRVAIADVAAMTLWGAAMPLAAIFPESVLGWSLVGLLALFSTCFELIQVLRDRESDQTLGVETTAVRFGPRWTLLALRLAMLLAAAYAILVLHRFVGLALLVAPLLAITADPARYWNRVRMVFGLTWIALIILIAFRGETDGALVQITNVANTR